MVEEFILQKENKHLSRLSFLPLFIALFGRDTFVHLLPNDGNTLGSMENALYDQDVLIHFLMVVETRLFPAVTCSF